MKIYSQQSILIQNIQRFPGRFTVLFTFDSIYLKYIGVQFVLYMGKLWSSSTHLLHLYYTLLR